MIGPFCLALVGPTGQAGRRAADTAYAAVQYMRVDHRGANVLEAQKFQSGSEPHPAAVSSTDCNWRLPFAHEVGQLSASCSRRQSAETFEVSASTYLVNVSFRLLQAGRDLWAALLWLGDGAVAVEWYPRRPYAEQDPNPTARVFLVMRDASFRDLATSDIEPWSRDSTFQHCWQIRGKFAEDTLGKRTAVGPGTAYHSYV